MARSTRPSTLTERIRAAISGLIGVFVYEAQSPGFSRGGVRTAITYLVEIGISIAFLWFNSANANVKGEDGFVDADSDFGDPEVEIPFNVLSSIDQIM